MERKPVTQGRNIATVGYDVASQTLEVEFSSGGIYSYASVPPDVHDKLIHAESQGGYFARFVRPCFECTHLNPKPKKEENNAAKDSTQEGQDSSAPSRPTPKKKKARV